MTENNEQGGPYVTAALLCEKVLQEKDGVNSIIRVITQLNISGPHEEMPATPIQVMAYLGFVAGFARGKYRLRLVPVSPSGKEMGGLDLTAYFEGDDRGVNIVVNLGMIVKEEGVFWIDVLLESQRVTRIPLRVLYQHIGLGTGGTQ